MKKKKHKSIIKSDCIIDGIVNEEILNITSNINKTMNSTISRLHLEAIENYAKIKTLIDSKQYKYAIGLYQKYEMFFHKNQEVYDLLNLIELDLIEDYEIQVYVVLNKLHIKELMKDWNYVKENVPLIIEKYSNSEHITKVKPDLMCIKAYANQKLGNIEVALCIYNELLNDKCLNYNLKANIYRNKALLENNPKFIETSSDLNIIAGEIEQAINAKMVLSDMLFGYAPEKSYQLIQEAEELCKTDDINDINLKSRIQYSKAIYLMNVHLDEKALIEIQKTIKTISNLYGDDINERRYACYVIALQLAQNLKNDKLCKEYEQKLIEIKETIDNEEFNQQLLAVDAMQLQDYTLLKQLRGENPDNFFIKYGANVICALADDSRTYLERLELLDDIKKDIDKPAFTADRKALLYRSYAILFHKHKQMDKYLEYANLSLQYNPFDTALRNEYIRTLMNTEKWDELEKLCQRQIDIFGEFPYLMYLYAKSMYKQQKDKDSLSSALYILNKYKDDIDKSHSEDCQKMISDLIASGTIPSSNYINKKDAPIPLLTLENFNNKLEEFKLYIQQKGRMRFWKNENGTHKFNNSPENIAKIAFMDFFKSEFGDQIEIIDEYKAGAGAIDLYIQFSPNLNIIVELKMCGKGYSSSYALEGNLQLKHYYENSGGTLCYLVVFDGRKNKNKKPNDNSIKRYSYEKQKYTIITRTIDIYPQTK